MLRSLALLGAVLVLAACAGGAGNGAAINPNDPNTLVVLAGSEVKDLEPMFPDVEKNTGVHLAVTYSGTLAGIDKLETGGENDDVAWFAQDKYFALTDQHHLIKNSTKIMLSPVILGVKESKARELHWASNSVTWADIERAVAAGRLKYAMTNPATSNSGFSAVVSVATAFTGSGDVVNANSVNQQRLASFFSGQKLIAGSSGWLSDAYVNSQDTIDGIVNYESVLLALNHSGRLKEPLTLIYPRDGVLTADYPMVLLNTAKSAAYEKVVNYLRSPAAQRAIMAQTYRRPILPAVPLSPDFPKGVLVDTSFPNNRATIDQILLAYLNKQRIPGHAYFVIDTSGSMDGERLNSVKTAFRVLTGEQNTLTARFARFDDREQVTIIPFAADVKDRRDFEMHGRDDPRTFASIRSYADGLTADGATAIYSALETALDEAQHDPSTRYDSIVLMTDGENNRGDGPNEFRTKYEHYQRKVRIFPIVVGEASPEELTSIAELSGGRSFDARSAPMDEIFKEIRGYQ
jgi:Ca-activated chloride channel family protein